jgi:hypothetical protein
VYCAPVNDSTVLIVAAGDGVWWGHFSQGQWSLGGQLSALRAYSSMPGPLRHAEFGYWVVWTMGDREVHVAKYENGAVSAWRDTITANYPSSLYEDMDAVELSQDARPRPVLAWMAYGDDGIERLYVSWPNANGWDTADPVPGATSGGHQCVARDENGDAWLAWFTYSGGIYWTHTYTTAICDTPSVGEAGGRPVVRWKLDRSAPETWWSVWRSRSGADFEQIARLEAGDGLAMSCTDSGAPAGEALRYRVRRECKDTRYRWTSAESEWLPRSVRLGLLLRSGNPVSGPIAVEVLGANAGGLELQLYDLQGRIVARTRANVAGGGREALSLGAAQGRLRSGLYVLRAKSADGRRSDGLKVVVLN